MITKMKRVGKKLKRPIYNTGALQNTATKVQFQQTLAVNLLDEYSQDIMEHWDEIRNAVNESCKETIGLRAHGNEDWFDENNDEMMHLTEQTRKAFNDYLNDRTSQNKKRKQTT